ncbi:MAG TPA: hypothetical protein VIL25_00750, partial [Vicinamibacterales bacterium]
TTMTWMAGLAALAIAQGVLLLRATRALTRVTTIETRLDKLNDALTLLTDTTESAFRAVAAEVTRLPAPSPAARRAASAARTRRVARAAQKGKSIAEIAAAEEMAEGEVRLRLHLAKDEKASKPARTPAKKSAGVNGRKVRRTVKALQAVGSSDAAVQVG